MLAMKCFVALMITFASLSAVFAQAPKKAYQYRGKTINEEAQVYEKADFDSTIIATLPADETFDISKALVNGAFYKIRISPPGEPSRLGFIADTDIKPLFKTAKAAESKAVGEEPEKNDRKKSAKKRPPRKKKSFENTRYVGPVFALIDFQEDTMGQKLHENLGFVGLKVSGPNVLLEGVPIDVNLLFYSGAPSYYKKATGNSASGFIFMGNILMQTYWPIGPNALTYFGFGPMMKYSKFDVELFDTTTSKNQPFSLEDISVGASFDVGLGFRAGPVALRVDYQYFWEKQMYGGFSGSLQWGF